MLFAGGKKASKKDFTGSFDAGKGTDISTFLINNGAQMILPVAGPQTGDVAGVIASTGHKGDVFTFGVDVDQSKVYNSDYFLGSAIKGIYISNAYALSELEKKHDHLKFEPFNMKFEDDPSFASFTTKLKKKLLKTHSGPDVDVMLKTTGFAPSSTMPSDLVTKIETKTIYQAAIQFIKDGKVSPLLTAPKTVSANPTNAEKAYKNFGGFMEVANG